ncbi:Adenylate kinase [Macleaya cordata]|uniref:adenylate kinase n=1 Tax=Macleaya cordata TaxID=56857 RepID=A0A200QY44_MACCD|nr:Adenylate kinase [Macleaya cordata]
MDATFASSKRNRRHTFSFTAHTLIRFGTRLYPDLDGAGYARALFFPLYSHGLQKDLKIPLHQFIFNWDTMKPFHVINRPLGSGKGTQSRIIKDEYCLCHLPTGHMLRTAVAAKTPLGIKAKEAMDKGELVSEDLVIKIIDEAIKKPSCQKGFILEWFPRTVVQAQKLDEMLAKQGIKIDKVLNFSIDDDAILEERITGRWIHLSSGRTYHTKFAPPKVPGVDDVTGEPLIRRKNDTAAVLKSKLEEFHMETVPVIDYYAKNSIVAQIHADKSPRRSL